MSDPVTNVDIEDVLSSIRRLVSEGDRSAGPRPATALRTPVAPATPDRFVLTPALRVVAPDVESAPESAESVAVETDDLVAANPAPLILTNASTLSQLETTIAELEAAVTSQDNEFEPDGSEDPAADDWTDAPLALRRRVADDSADDAEIADPSITEPEPTEPRVAFRHFTYDDSNDDHHDDLMEDDEPADDLTAYLDDDSSIDQNALRDLVAQIVRAELQGELGERITRNVRKLVRREIYRVVNSQEFE